MKVMLDILLQMLQEKHRFKKTPYNYAMRKTQLMKERDMALLKYNDHLIYHFFDCSLILQLFRQG